MDTNKPQTRKLAYKKKTKKLAICLRGCSFQVRVEAILTTFSVLNIIFHFSRIFFLCLLHLAIQIILHHD